MVNILKSKPIAWLLFLLIIVWVICNAVMKAPWWMYIPVFFAFMSTFCNLASLYLVNINAQASNKLKSIDTVLNIAFIVSLLIVLFI